MDALKNLASINQTLLFPKGNTLITRSVKKHTYAEIEVPEKFPKRFTIYDLNMFLSVTSQFAKPTLDFGQSEEFVVISEDTGDLSVEYFYGDESLAYVPDPKKKIQLPSQEVEFTLTEGNFKVLSNLARTIGTPELSLSSDGKNLKLMTVDTKNSATNKTKLIIGDAPSKAVFDFVWKIEYLKLVPGTYTVSVSKEGLSRFKHKEQPITYHILLEANATRFEE